MALYVVNGTAINNTNKAEIISHDSKTITIYNSPEATVQYGEARANGAVIIETKK